MVPTYKNVVKEKPEKFDGKKWHYAREVFIVEVMAEAKGYAMVRRKGCMPFVVSSKELQDIT